MVFYFYLLSKRLSSLRIHLPTVSAFLYTAKPVDITTNLTFCKANNTLVSLLVPLGLRRYNMSIYHKILMCLVCCSSTNTTCTLHLLQLSATCTLHILVEIG